MRYLRSHPNLVGVVWVACMAFVAMTMLGFVGRAWAQVLDPLAPVQAYTTADPIDPDRLGLATLDGRYAVTPVQGCDWLAPYQVVLAYPNWQLPPWLGLSGTDSLQPGCVVRVEGRMSATPCFTDDTGICDLTQEFD